MTLPDIEKGGKACRDFANKLRKRIKRGKADTFTPEESAWMVNWDAKIATMPKGRPVGSGNDSQSGSESQPEGGAGQTDVKPPSSPSDPAPPVTSDVPLEAPPKVTPTVVAAVATGGDWRKVHRDRTAFTGDGRQLLCEQIADAWAEGLGALVDDMKKAGKDPIGNIDPRLPMIKSLAVLAFDELLPEKAKLSPKVALLVVTTGTVAQRAYHHKAITAALKDDPATIEWRKRQEAREAQDQNLRAANAEQVAKAKAEPQYAEPPPAPEPEKPINGTPFAKSPRAHEQSTSDAVPLV